LSTIRHTPGVPFVIFTDERQRLALTAPPQERELNMGTVIKTIICPVSDVARATRLYSSLLGVGPYVDTPYYVGFRVGDQEVGLDPHGHRGAGAVAYYEVADIKQSLQELLDAGAETLQEVNDVGGGKLVASVKDADGNAIGLMQNT
jgi:predicted enzyme related to lactoylglutathione lyase